MSKLNKIFESLQNRIDSGEITLETANTVLEKAKAKYKDEKVGELKKKCDKKCEDDECKDGKCTKESPETLGDAMETVINALNEAEESLKCGGECCASTATTSKDAPDLPEKTNTGEQVTNAIDANDNASEKKMETLAKNNEANAKADADGEEDRDTTVNADELTEAVTDLRHRVFEANYAGIISDEDKATYLEYLNIDNYSFKEEPVNESEDAPEEEQSDETEIETSDCDEVEASLESTDDIIKRINDLRYRTFEACESGAIDKETRDLFLEHLDINNYAEPEESVEESAVDTILDAFIEGTITEDQAIKMITK